MSLPVPEPLPRELGPGGLARRAGGLVALGLVVALLISTLPGLDEVRQRLAHAEPGWLIGGIDGGLIGALTLYGSPLSQATAAVLAYRVVQLGIPAILGAVAFVQLRSTLVREEAPAALCEPFDQPLPVFTLPPR